MTLMYEKTLTWNPFIGCEFNCVYCLDKDTDILMYDASTKKIVDIQIGDELVGMHKVQRDKFKVLELTKSVVLSTSNRKTNVIRITFVNGQTIDCSPDHRWLTNRGWKYTVGAMSGRSRRPYLTTTNKIFRIYDPSEHDFELTDEYMKGYLCGMIRGDGTMGIYDYSGSRGRKSDTQHVFRVALKDLEGIDRTAKYLEHFDIHTNKFIFNGGRGCTLNAIGTRKKAHYHQIINLIEYSDTDEFYRGFVSGAFDAEGSYSVSGALRIFNSDDEYLETICTGLRLFGFKFSLEPVRENGVRSVLLKGGISKQINFFQIMNPVISRKRTVRHKMGSIKIKSIEALNEERLMYDIGTSTENFIADGLISHNCYAPKTKRRHMHLCEKCGEFTPHEHLERLNQKFPKGSQVFVCSLADIAWATEEYMQRIYEAIAKQPEVTFLLQSKDPSCFLTGAYEELIPDNAIIGTTIETNRFMEGTSGAPSTPFRHFYTCNTYNVKQYITIEPIMEFDLDVMVQWIREIRPEFVYIGYDNHKHKLPEPSLDETEALIAELEKFTEVRRKTIRPAWWE